MRYVSIACLMVAAACGGYRAPQTALATKLRGIVSVEGSAPTEVVIVSTADGGRVGITGDLRPTIASLAGAEIAVTGTREDGMLPGTSGSFRASTYDVLSVQGLPASMGVLDRDGDHFVLRGDVVWILSDVPEALARRVNRTVWVAGEHADTRIRVQLWGEIRTGA